MIISKNNFKDFGLQSIDYMPSMVFRNGHVSTMYPYAMRKVSTPSFIRERWTTVDNDFIDIDMIKKSSETAIILLHGLEGSSQSQYIKGVISAIDHLPIDIYAVNHRSCSGEMNLTSTMYHSGFTTDLVMILDRLSHYESIALVGYSLGGNITLKYLGTHQPPQNLKTAIAISVPTDLTSSAVRLLHWTNRAYAIQFLMTLMKKGRIKGEAYPDIINQQALTKVKTLKDFDDVVTAPLHGFKDADDYYLRASSKPTLQNITIPTLLLNAYNDTFLAPPCFPSEIANGHEFFHLLATKYGGHVGYGDWSRSYSFADDVVVDWLGMWVNR